MDEMKWAKLTEVFGRMEAELIESYLAAENIEVELFQEAVGHHIYPTTIDGLAKVQIFVRNDQLQEALVLLEQWNGRNGEEINDEGEE